MLMIERDRSKSFKLYSSQALMGVSGTTAHPRVGSWRCSRTVWGLGSSSSCDNRE
jgi:hypothetical protein